MIIDLLSIDEEGKTFSFNESSDEVESLFTDLIGKNPFTIEVLVKPLGNSYQIQGRIQSHYGDVCSRCGYDIEVPLNGRMNEIVVIEKERPRNTQVSQSQRSLDESGPDVTYLKSPEFDLAEFLHEMMAASQNRYPRCVDEAQCEAQQAPVQESQAPSGHPGFAALKNIKLKH
ncbi:MAG: DUF177 domain-containing protein [Bdellovibrionales bacterium]|nr:DUF177 domain-containing protein [Bdellovibrionales bacterium]